MPDYHALTSALDFANTNVVVIGGTQGIGGGIALRFAELGASVLIIGSNEKLGNEMVESLKQRARRPDSVRFGFVRKDLGVVKGIKEAAEEIAAWAGDDGVHYLFQSQGGPGRYYPLTPEKVAGHFNVQILSHFLIPYLLLTRPNPSLHKGAQISNIMRPGEINRDIDLDDIVGLKALAAGKFSMRNQPFQAVFMADLFTHEFNLKFPDTHTTHIYPGPVRTDLYNSPNIPCYIRVLLKTMFYFAWLTPAQYAEIAIWQIASEEGKSKKRTFWDQYSREVKVDKRVESDAQLRQAIWDGILRIGEV